MFFFIVDITDASSCTSFAIGMTIAVYPFYIGLGTFVTISYLRNHVIRKPLQVISRTAIKIMMIVSQVYAILVGFLCYFAYSQKYTSKTLYSTYWWISSLSEGAVLLTIILLNCWSTKFLAHQSEVNDLNTTEERTRKRNQAAVGILNMISLVYFLCTMPVLIYYIVFVIVFMTYTSDSELFYQLNDYFAFIHLPLFLCSGFNALVYILKDRNITRYLQNWFRC